MANPPLSDDDLNRRAKEKESDDKKREILWFIECAKRMEKEIDEQIDKYQNSGRTPPYEFDISMPTPDGKKQVYNILENKYSKVGWVVTSRSSPAYSNYGVRSGDNNYLVLHSNESIAETRKKEAEKKEKINEEVRLYKERKRNKQCTKCGTKLSFSEKYIRTKEEKGTQFYKNFLCDDCIPRIDDEWFFRVHKLNLE